MTKHRVALHRHQTNITEIKVYLLDRNLACKVPQTNHRDSLAL